MGEKPIWIIVDDAGSLLNDIVEMVRYEFENVEVVGFSNGFEALEYFMRIEQDGKSNLQLIVSDIMMPGMGGFELLQSVRALPHVGQSPFVFLTAKTDRSDIRYGMELGANDYITKPFDVKEFLESLRAVVATWQWQHGHTNHSQGLE